MWYRMKRPRQLWCMADFNEKKKMTKMTRKERCFSCEPIIMAMRSCSYRVTGICWNFIKWSDVYCNRLYHIEGWGGIISIFSHLPESKTSNLVDLGRMTLDGNEEEEISHFEVIRFLCDLRMTWDLSWHHRCKLVWHVNRSLCMDESNSYRHASFLQATAVGQMKIVAKGSFCMYVIYVCRDWRSERFGMCNI